MSLSINTREIVLLILEPKKQGKTLEERRVLRKTERCLKNRKGGERKRYGTILFWNVIDRHLILITVRENSFSYSFIVI